VLPTLLIYAVLLAGAFVMFLPFMITIATALSKNIYALTTAPTLIPREPTVDNFVTAWTSNRFALYFLNSLQVAVATTVLTVALAAMQGYAFARLDFPAKNAIFTFYLLTLSLPTVVLIIPQFIQARALGLLNTLPALVLIYVAGSVPFQTFFMRSFFERIPKELEEAAYIDGCSRLGAFLRIALPLSLPALGTAAIFAFLASWDEFTWALTAINDVEKRTLPIAIRLFQGQHSSQWGLVFAAGLIAIVPVMAVFVLFQSAFVKGLSVGGVKG
jgi:multiple sugar transport system permease protein